MVDLTIIIVTYNSEKDIVRCLNSVYSTKGDLSIEIFLVDNVSKDHTVDIIRKNFSEVQLIVNRENKGFPGANNQAIKLSRGRYIMLLNPDTIVFPKAFQEIIAYMDDHTTCGICGPVLIDQHGVIWPDLMRPSVLRELAILMRVVRYIDKMKSKNRELIDVVSGACLVIRASIIPIVGLLDDRMHRYEDGDYSYRVNQKGFAVCKVNNARVVHLAGQSTISNMEYSLKKYYSSLILYHQKHSKRATRLCVYCILIVQAGLRFIKYYVLSLWNRSSDVAIRKKTFKKIFLNMPEIIKGSNI